MLPTWPIDWCLHCGAIAAGGTPCIVVLTFALLIHVAAEGQNREQQSSCSSLLSVENVQYAWAFGSGTASSSYTESKEASSYTHYY